MYAVDAVFFLLYGGPRAISFSGVFTGCDVFSGNLDCCHHGFFLLCGQYRQLFVALRLSEYDHGTDALVVDHRCGIDSGWRIQPCADPGAEREEKYTVKTDE